MQNTGGIKMSFKELIKSKGFTQEKLGAIVHKSHTTIYSWCKGICEPDCKSIILLAKVLDVSVEQIVKVFAKVGD